MLGIAYASPGELDTSFNSPHGFTIYDSGFSDGGECVAVQNDGKILMGGWIQRSGGFDALLLRYRVDGTPDTTFGTNGVVVYDGGLSKRAAGIAIQPDGKILIVGSVYDGGDYDMFVLRVNTDGAPDNGFGENGLVVYDSGVSDLGRRIALQPDGKILVGGATDSGTDSKILLMRYNTNGSLDTGFGTNGAVLYDDPLPLFAKGVAIQSDGKIVVLASKSENDPAGSDILLLRYNTDGTLDTSFGTNGAARYDSGHLDLGRSLAIQADGKLVVAGATTITSAWSDYHVLLLRYNKDGAPDTTFGLSGLVEYSAGFFDEAWSATLQIDGKILVSGKTANTDDSDVLLLRYNKDGALDATFGRQGVARYDSGFKDGAQDVAVQADGKIVVLGWKDEGMGLDIAVMRFTGGGLVVEEHGTFYIIPNRKGGGAVIYLE